MNPVTRGFRNAFRNSIRTFSIVAILGLSIGLALAMLVARQAVDSKITAVKQSLGNSVTISPAGVQGFAGGGEPLTVTELDKVAKLPHISSLTQSLSDRLTTDSTNLVSAIEAGSFGRRQSANSGVDFQPPAGGPEGAGGGVRSFTPPVVVTGVNSASANSVFGGSTPKYLSGAALNPTLDENIAVVGKSLADKNSLKVGSTFTAYGASVKVVGVYDSGNTFNNAGIVMPLVALQRLSGQPGAVTSAVAIVDSVDNLDSATATIKSTLGTSADVASSQETAKQVIAPLDSVKTVSTMSLLGAVAAGSIILLLTMLMIVRERRREIGVMKAIGASGGTTMLQFMSEAATLTLLGLAVGLVLGVAAASPITSLLVQNSTTTATATQAGPGFGGAARGALGSLRGAGRVGVENLRTVKATVGWNTLGLGAGLALLIALVGSAIPTYLMSKVRPAEVMRAE